MPGKTKILILESAATSKKINQSLKAYKKAVCYYSSSPKVVPVLKKISPHVLVINHTRVDKKVISYLETNPCPVLLLSRTNSNAFLKMIKVIKPTSFLLHSQLPVLEETLRVLCSMLDKNKVEKDNAVLQDSERLFYTVFHNSFIGKALIDENRRYVDVNERYLKFVKKKRGDLIGKTSMEAGLVDPDKPNLWEPLWQRIRKGEAVENHEFTGTVPVGNVSILISLNPINLSGRRLFLVSINDISEWKNTQQELEISRIKFKELVEQASDGIIISDSKGNYIDVNRRGCEMTGYTREELLKLSIRDLVAEDLEKSPLRIDQLLQGKQLLSERKLKRKDGSFFYAEISSKMLSDGNLQAIVRDITERKRAELGLMKSEERYRQVIERVSDAFVSLDTNWVYTYVNKKAGEIFGRDPESLMGKHIWTEFPEGVGQPFYKKYYQAAETQQYAYLLEYYPPWDKWYENHIYPSADGLTIFFKDVTERIKAEAIEKKLVQRNQGLINAIPDLMFIINSEGVYVDFHNAKGQDTYTPPEYFLGKSVFEVLPEQLAKEAHHNVKRTLQGNETLTHSYILDYGNGLHFFEARYAKASDTEVLILVQDVTNQKLAEQKILTEKNLSDSLINSLPGIFYLINEDGSYIRWNKQKEEVTGYSSEEMSRMHSLDFFEGEDRERVRKKIMEGIETGYTEVEAHLVTKSGKRFLYYFTGVAIEYQGKRCLVGTGIDITERVKAQQKVELMANRNQTILQTMLDGYILAETDGQIVETNPSYCRMVGYSRDELLRMNINKLEGKLSQEEIERRIAMMVEKKSIRFETRHIKKDGSPIDLEVNISVMEQEGKPLIAAFVRDITHRLQSMRELQALNSELKKLAVHLQEVRENERKDVARELHDQLGQVLTALKMDLSWVAKRQTGSQRPEEEKLKEAMRLAEEAIETTRRINAQLRPRILEDLGLVPAIEWLLKETSKRTGIAYHWQCNTEQVDLDQKRSIAIYRILQETLTNIIKHARATEIKVTLIKNGVIDLEIADNGKGFDPASPRKRNSFGLIGIQERIDYLKGKMLIDSKSRKGTTLRFQIPL